MALSNAQYNSILRLYDEKQLRNRRQRDARIAEAYAKLPRLREIDEEIASLSVQAARSALGQDVRGDADNLPGRIDSLSEERRALLSMGGFPEDYLEEHYDCLICGDTGFVDGQKCSCFHREESRLLYAQSNLDAVLAEDSFDRFSLDYYSPEIAGDADLSPREAAAEALEKARDFVSRFGKEFTNLYLCGEVGTGKTFLTHCIARELLARDVRVLYFSSSQLFDVLGKATIWRDRDLAGAPEDITSCDLLIIDDLGSELTNSFVSAQLFSCINDRLLTRRPTIISTNLPLSDVREVYSERIASRIAGYYQIIELHGQDIRRRKQLS